MGRWDCYPKKVLQEGIVSQKKELLEGIISYKKRLLVEEGSVSQMKNGFLFIYLKWLFVRRSDLLVRGKDCQSEELLLEGIVTLKCLEVEKGIVRIKISN